MASSLHVYEVLKKHMDEEAARVIAEALPLSEQLATKADIQALRGDFRAELHRMEAAIYRWMLTFFATLWLGMAGMIVAILVTR